MRLFVLGAPRRRADECDDELCAGGEGNLESEQWKTNENEKGNETERRARRAASEDVVVVLMGSEKKSSAKYSYE